jgi:hypothetical protein
MSFVTLIIIKGKRITVVHVHYREALRLLHTTCKHVRQEEIINTLDAGYILVDHNTQTVMNAQYAIPVLLPHWTYIEV